MTVSNFSPQMAQRLHPERMELTRSMESVSALVGPLVPLMAHELLTREELHMRAAEQPLFAKALEVAGEAPAHLWALLEWARWRLGGAHIIQTNDYGDLLLRQTDLDLSSAENLLNFGHGCHYVAFGESWDTRLSLESPGQGGCVIEGAYVTGQHAGRNRQIELMICGRLVQKSRFVSDFVESVVLNCGHSLFSFNDMLNENFTGRNRPHVLDQSLMREIVIHLGKVAGYLGLATRNLLHSEIIDGIVPSPAALNSRDAAYLHPFAVHMIGPQKLDDVMPADVLATDKPLQWLRGKLQANYEGKNLRLKWVQPIMQPVSA